MIYVNNAPVVLTVPGRYYFKAGFYMFFGWLTASLVLTVFLAIAFVFAVVFFGLSIGGFHR